jgi:hypothetical protein
MRLQTAKGETQHKKNRLGDSFSESVSTQTVHVKLFSRVHRPIFCKQMVGLSEVNHDYNQQPIVVSYSSYEVRFTD